MSSEPFRDYEDGPIDNRRIPDSQQTEILRRLAECELKPQELEPFEESDLETMIHKICRRV